MPVGADMCREDDDRVGTVAGRKLGDDSNSQSGPHYCGIVALLLIGDAPEATVRKVPTPPTGSLFCTT